jgi:hypothetical protein
MFDLEQAIAEWRRQVAAGGIKSPAVLDELESHLREDVEQQTRLGISAEHTFKKAVERIGHPAALQKEFAKAGATKRARLRRLKDALLRFIGVPRPSAKPLTAGAREILELGGKAALGFHHDFIGTEHVLLGLLESQSGVVPAVLRRMGLDREIVGCEIEKVIGVGPAQPSCPTLPFTPRVKRALELAGLEARALDQTQVGAEHIFLGLLLEGSGVAALVLKALGVNIQTAREELLNELRRNRPGF